ncbi:MAG: PilN domain-containing protein [Lysobacter sp.]|nr:PilN domain-containing protein [Lysobacter sp.]
MSSPAESFLAPLREAASRAGLTDFLRWWQGELAALVPPSWRERLGKGGVAYVAVRDSEWRVLRPSQGSLAVAGRVAMGSLDTTGRRAAFRRLLEDGSGGGAANVWLVLEPEDVLVRTVAMPLAAEEALRDAVGFELDRLTPFSADHACFDFRVTGRDATAQRLAIDLAVTARAPVASRLAELRELGATVLGVGVAADLASSGASLNLLAPEERERPATSPTVVAARALAAVAVALALVALVYPLWQKREAVIALQPRLEKAKAGADVAERLVKEIEKLAAEHNFLVEKKQAQRPAVVLLEDLSRILPDTTWVQQLDIKSNPKFRELQIAGETGSSSQLIEVLEKSGSLANASFKSPLTKGVSPGTERFLVSAEVKPRPLPPPMPESALMEAPAVPTPAASPPAVPPPAASPAAVPASSPATPAQPAPATGGAAPVSAPRPAAPTPAAPAVPAGGVPAPAPAAPAPKALVPPSTAPVPPVSKAPVAPPAPVQAAPAAKATAPASSAKPPEKG